MLGSNPSADMGSRGDGSLLRQRPFLILRDASFISPRDNQSDKSLGSIAQKHYGDGSKWRRILEANEDKISQSALFKPWQSLLYLLRHLLSHLESDYFDDRDVSF